VSPQAWLRLASIACAALAPALWVSVLMADRDSALCRAWARYCAQLERNLCRLFVFWPGHRVAVAQLVTLFVLTAVAVAMPLRPSLWAGLMLVAVAGPPVWLRRMVRRRVQRIDQQVDGFLVATANALKSRPAVGDALAAVVTLTAKPLRQEIELSVKQMRFGSSVDQALLHMGGRIGSKPLDTALSAILIGRELGGSLPTVLETTAATMREMARLEGVIRANTAQGKAQIWVLALFPFVLMFAFNAVSPGYFDTMSSSLVGYIATGIALGLWGASILAARRILAVDI
jgi:tight adherence protein B